MAGAFDEVSRFARGLRGLIGSRSSRGPAVAMPTILAAPGYPRRASVPPPEPSLRLPKPDRGEAGVAALLADIDQIRPGLVRHRALVLGDGSGTFVKGLSQRFDECDSMDVGIEGADHNSSGRPQQVADGEGLPFADETFDFVHCGTLVRDRDDEHAGRVIGEAIRVLRLFGVVVVEVVGEPPQGESLRGEPPQGGPLPERDASGRLDVRLSAPQRLSLTAGQPAGVSFVATNTGAITLGSVVSPLRLESYWRRPDAVRDFAKAADVAGSLLPGATLSGTLAMPGPAAPGEHVVELCLVSPGPWGELRSPTTIVTITVVPPERREPGDARGAVPPEPGDPLTPVVERSGGAILSVVSAAAGPDGLPRRRYFLARA